MRNIVLKTLALGLLLAASARAGTTNFNFDTDPAGFLNINSTLIDPPPWRNTGGNPATGGYLAITDSFNSQSSVIVFDDFDNGLIVKAFNFSMDVRVGNATGNAGRPADGFSVSYARSSDPVITSLAIGDFAVSGAPENGTRTGIAISFDTWSGNALPDGADIEGLIVRVDNATVLRQALPTRNGLCADLTSIQTGPYDAVADAAGMGGSPDGLCWARVEVVLNESLQLTVRYKGATLLDNYQTTYAPSAGRLVLAGRTGGANENTHVDNISITTIPADTFVVGAASGNPAGFSITIDDSGPSILNPSTLAVQFNGATITPTGVNKSGPTTTVSYQNTTTFLAPGSTNTVVITAQDTRGVNGGGTRQFVLAPYATIPASYALAAPATVPGMNVGTHQIDAGRGPGDANLIPNAEQQWALGFIDPATGQPYPNIASPTTATANWVNWEQLAAEVNAASPYADNFNTEEPTAAPIPNEAIPGISIPGAGTLGDGADNIVAEVSGYFRLTRGAYRMGVNSDDGFVLSTGPGGPGPFGLVLGSFNGGRGASDSVFDFAVEAAGDYPFRLLWWEGGGGANVEWFAVNIDTGEKILVNHTNPNSVKAFRTGAGRAYVKSLLPANGYTGVNPNVTVRAELVDGATTVVDGSVSLVIDGNPVTATIVNGATTTVTWTPAAGLPVDSTHTGRLIWTESTTPATVWTNNFTFTIRRMVPDDLPAQGAFWIEAEDWDHSSGQSVASASTMPYLGGAYDGLAGVLNVDYFDDQNDGDAGIDFTYRTDKRPNHVNITVNTANRFAVDRPGPVDLTIDYRIGWVGNTWCNYTRQVPAGVYKAYAALSIDNSNVDAMQADLDRVTAGVGTTSQTLERLGTFFGRGNGAWGSSEMAVLRDSLGNDAIFNVEGANTTFRVTARSGDFAWFVLIPTTSPAKLRTGPPQGTAPFSIPHTLKWVLDDFSTTINTATASLKIDGATVTAPAFTVTKTGKVTTATYVADIGNPHTYEFSINDSAGATIATTGVFIGNFMTPSPTGMFLIETEDFNTAGGQVQAAVNTMPYLGNAYNGLSATANIDYARTADEPSGNVYRLTEVPNVPFSGDGDMVRARDAAGAATWTLTANYRLGWAGAGNWYNFTRQIPAGSYQVWASMSYGDATDADVQLVGNLSRVTSDPTQGSQTIESIGYFRGPATGGWGANQLVPLRASDTDISGPAAVVTLGGPTATTLRFEDASGDLDYFMLVPSAPGLRFNPPGLSGGQMTISWTGTGTLQQTDSLSPPNWGPAPSQANPQTVTASDASKYYRLQQ